MEFGYDNFKRVSSYQYTQYDSATGELSLTFYIAIRYNGADTTPFKLTGSEPASSQDEGEIATFYKNGDLSYVRYFNPQYPADSTVKTYEYTGDNDVSISYVYPSGTCDNDTVYHTTFEINGNVVNDQKIYSYSYPERFAKADLQGIFTHENSFDTHPNPFKKINFRFLIFSLAQLTKMEHFFCNG
jgi:hypothetical protein